MIVVRRGLSRVSGNVGGVCVGVDREAVVIDRSDSQRTPSLFIEEDYRLWSFSIKRNRRIGE